MFALVIERLWDGRPADESERVVLEVHDDGDALRLRLDAPLHGDPRPPGPPGPTWGLWEHEVVELFVLGPDDRYTEVELGPWGHHLVLRLEGRRNAVERELPLTVSVARSRGRWAAEARLPRDLLPAGPHRLNAYAIHGHGPDRRYLAWAPVPGPSPDFHRLEHFPAAPAAWPG